jgi:outer membrane lipoprotein-sorting protein
MINPKICFIVLAGTFAFFTFSATGFSQSKALLPQAIIQNMAERYAALSSYQDSGVVETVSEGALPRRNTDVFFKSYFTRPGKLRFEWMEYSSLSVSGRSVIWSDGSKAFSFLGFKPEQVEAEEDIGMAVAGATGISRGSAHTVPSLLINEIDGFLLTELTKLSLKREEVFEGEECYVVEGYHPNGEAWQLWISKKESLLRKLRTKSTNGEFEEEIHRDIKVGDKIPEAMYQPKVERGRIADPLAKEKEADIRRLLELVVPRDRLNQQLNEVLIVMKKIMPQVPEKTWQEVIAELHLDSEMILQIYVPIYDWHYTDEEIRQLIGLYESPLGQKIRINSGLIELEAARHAEKVGEELMHRIEERLRSRGYKLPAT